MAGISSSWYLYYKNQAHSAIESGFNNAITHYAQQKRAFLEQLNVETDEEAKNFMDQVNMSIEEEAENTLGDTFDEAYDAIKDYLNEFFQGIINNDESTYNEGYAEVINKFQALLEKEQQGKVNPQNEYNNMKKNIEQYLALHNIDRTSIAHYVAAHTSLGSTDNIDIQNNLFGYARKLMLEQLRGNKLQHDTIHYKRSLAGYYKEELLVPALKKILNKYRMSAQQSGSQRDEKGRQIQIDIALLGNVSGNKQLTDKQLEKLLNFGAIKTQQEKQTITVNLVGGVQSKSWVVPWSQRSSGGNRAWLDFGNHSEQIPTGNGVYSWHAGVNNLMRNMVPTIGVNNFIFSTGDTVYFTADLLKDFRARQYVLAFTVNKGSGKIENGNVQAMPHKDKN